MQPKGRHWIMGWLVLFLVVAGIVVARQRSALQAARELTRIQNERSAVEARLADLERRILDGRSRKVLIPRAESLGLHLPSDSEFTRFMLPDSARRGTRSQ